MRKIILVCAVLVIGISVMAQEYKVNTKNSTVKWLGKKINKQHNGTVGLKEGNFKIEDNRLVGGSFLIDLNLMTDESSNDPASPSRLVNHLKSDDFFNVEKYPEAKLEIVNSEPFEKGESLVKGNLTIRGITHPIEFKVLQKGAIFSSSLVFDRSLYEVKYGSGKFFQDLGDKAIADEIAIDVSLVAEKQR